MIADGRVEVLPSVRYSFPLAEAGAAYEALLEGSSALGIVIGYPKPQLAREPALTIRLRSGNRGPQNQHT